MKIFHSTIIFTVLVELNNSVNILNMLNQYCAVNTKFAELVSLFHGS